MQGVGLHQFGALETKVAAEVRSILGVFNPRYVTLETRMQMRNHPDVAFGLAILRSPIINLRWTIESEDEEVAAFVEAALRPKYRQLAVSGSQAMTFGNQVVAKEWKTAEAFRVKQTDQASEKGKSKVYPLAWVPARFKAIDPRGISLLIDPERDEWAGVEQRRGNQIIRVGPEGAVFWAFRREEAFGKLCGYPITDQAYRPWYSSEALDIMANRYFEKKADPPTKGRAAAEVQGANGQKLDGFQYLAAQAQALRGGGQFILPGAKDQQGNYLFDLEFMLDDKRGDMYQQRLDALSTQILRSLWIPDKAGTSDGTGSLAMAEVHAETMALGLEAVLAEWIDDVVNEQVVMPIAEFNFGVERARDAQPRMKGSGISPAMQALYKELIINLLQVEQLQESGKRIKFGDVIDGPAIAQQMGLPMRSEDELKEMMEQMEDDETAATDELIEPGAKEDEAGHEHEEEHEMDEE